MSKTKPRFQIAQPSLTSAEDKAFDAVLGKLRSTGYPVNQSASQPVSQSTSQSEIEQAQPVSQSTKLDSQSTALVIHATGQLDNQSTSQPVNQSAIESKYRSRIIRKLKGIRLPVAKLKKYEIWCFANDVDFQDAAEFALDWLTSQPVNRMLIDDNSDDSDDELSSIARIYERWTGNKTNAKDREAIAEVEHLPVQAVELGILLGCARSNQQRINSFRYFLGSIREAAESGVKDLEGGYSTHLMKVLKAKGFD